MRKFGSVHKGNGRKYILTFNDKGKVCAFDIEKGIKKKISEKTVKRWHEVGEEIKPEKPKKHRHRRPVKERCIKKNGEVRKDKFRPKLEVQQVKEIRNKYEEGVKKSHLAREYGVSFRTITCVVDRLMWKHVD